MQIYKFFSVISFIIATVDTVATNKATIKVSTLSLSVLLLFALMIFLVIICYFVIRMYI